jgi:hypothetical protein
MVCEGNRAAQTIKIRVKIRMCETVARKLCYSPPQRNTLTEVCGSSNSTSDAQDFNLEKGADDHG